MKRTFILAALLALCLALPLRAQEVETPEQPAEPNSVETYDQTQEMETPEQPAKPEKPEKPKSEKTYDRARIVLNFWSTNYTGNMEVVQEEQVLGTDVLVGEDLDLVDDFGLENPKDAFEIQALVRLGKKNRIHLSWFTVDYGAEENLDVPVEFAGYEFEANTDLKTVWRISRFKFVHEYDPLCNEKGRLGLMWGMEYFMWEVGFKGVETSSGLRVDESEFFPLPVPVVGMSGAINFGYGFGIEASAMGISVGLGDFTASYSDIDVGLIYDYKWLHVGLSYRYLNSRVDADENEDEENIKWNTTQEGMILGIGVNI